MSNEPHSTDEPTVVELPEPTIAPMVLALGITLMAAGVATSLTFLFVGLSLFAIGLGMWISQLLPGRGHYHEPLIEAALRSQAVNVAVGGVDQMRQGKPGYRLRLPEKMHPISAGIKGGMVGGLVMPLPAMAYGLLSGRGIWLPLNLLSGMVLPSVGDMSDAELEQFQPTLFALGIFIHITVSLVLGLIYGVLMPMLPSIPRPFAWGALLMPLLWTAVSFAAMGFMNPAVRDQVEWPWFVVSQFVFGMAAAAVFMRMRKKNLLAAGLLGGIAGGLLMPIPALLWGVFTKHGIWYPVNLLSAMALPHANKLTVAELEQFHAQWLLAAIVLHLSLSINFGLAFSLILPRLPAIPGPLAWGGLVLPLLWTAASYGLMGVVNPVLQERVDWPWFVASQFVFGVVAAIVVVRSEQVAIPPAGRGPEQPAEYL